MLINKKYCDGSHNSNNNNNKECICKAPYSQITCSNARWLRKYLQINQSIIIQEFNLITAIAGKRKTT